MTVAEAIDAFVSSKRGAGRSPTTVEHYIMRLRVFVRWIEESGIGGNWYTPAAIERYLDYRRESGRSPHTVAGDYNTLHIWFQWLRRRGLLPQGEPLPTERIERPRVPRKRQREATPEQYATLLDSIPRDSWVDRRDRLMVATFFLTGVRRGELLQLRLEDYDVGRATLTVRNGKGGHDRIVPLLPAVADEYRSYMVLRPETHHPEVMLAADGSYHNVAGVLTGVGVRMRMNFLCQRAGLPRLNPHSFRHGLAMHLLNDRGANMSLIQKILGHKRLSTTAEIYAIWEYDGIAANYMRLMNGETE